MKLPEPETKSTLTKNMMAFAAGLLTAGPLGMVFSPLTMWLQRGKVREWALTGLLFAPVLIIAQLAVVDAITQPSHTEPLRSSLPWPTSINRTLKSMRPDVVTELRKGMSREEIKTILGHGHSQHTVQVGDVELAEAEWGDPEGQHVEVTFINDIAHTIEVHGFGEEAMEAEIPTEPFKVSDDS